MTLTIMRRSMTRLTSTRRGAIAAGSLRPVPSTGSRPRRTCMASPANRTRKAAPASHATGSTAARRLVILHLAGHCARAGGHGLRSGTTLLLDRLAAAARARDDLRVVAGVKRGHRRAAKDRVPPGLELNGQQNETASPLRTRCQRMSTLSATADVAQVCGGTENEMQLRP